MAWLKKYGIFGLAAVWTAIIFGIFLVKHNYQFQTFGLDTGFFGQIIFKASLGDFSSSTISQWSFFTDHFQPILLLFVPFYWLQPDIRWLYFSEALLFSLSVLPLFYLAMKVIKSYMFAYALVIGYFLLVPAQHGIFDGFSQAVFVAPFLALVYYSLEIRKDKLFWFSIAGLLLVKEEFSLLVAGLGLVIFLSYKRKVLGTAVFLLGLGFFLILTKILNPLISPGNLNYAHQNVGYGNAGYGLTSVIIYVATHPWLLATSFFDSGQKIQTIASHLLGFGFLPLLAPGQLVLLYQQYILRFLNDQEPIKWLAHDFAFGPILFAAAVYGLRNLLNQLVLKQRKAVLIFASFLVFAGAVSGDFLFHGPINSLLKLQFYRQPQWAAENLQILQKVPHGVSVAANNSLVPHLSSRKEIYLLPDIRDAEYIAVDLHNGPNNYAPIDFARTETLIGRLIAEKKYKIILQSGQALLLQKI